MIKRTLIALILGICLVAWGFGPQTLVEQRRDVRQFIDYMAKTYNYDPVQLTAMFNTIQVVPPRQASIVRSQPILKHLQAKHDFVPWYQYESFFITQLQIDMGVQFWLANKKWLTKASKLYGIPPSILVATIGVETKYGEQMGTYPVFQSLAVLAFDGQHRETYFRQELIAFLLYCRKNNIDPLVVHGSYTGAIGEPQFMPSNIPAYGVDLDENGTIDIINDSADAIGSVANFFHRNNWHTGEPVIAETVISGDKITELLKTNPEPKMTVEAFAEYGITPKQKVDPTLTATLITLTETTGPIYVLTFHNFLVLKDYNASTDYAMALYSLSVDVARKYHALVLKHREEAAEEKQEKVTPATAPVTTPDTTGSVSAISNPSSPPPTDGATAPNAPVATSSSAVN